jgi:pSer/pThr/pTyr-binding forkhead associated (FHA) protein
LLSFSAKLRGVQTFWLRYRGTRFPIRRGEYILGRSPYCSIVVSNALASRQHCAVRLTSEGLVIADLNSRNGTLVNGKRLEMERLVVPGDVIRIGSDSIEVLVAESQAERKSARRGERHDTLDRLELESVPSSSPSSSNGLEEDSSTYTHNSTIELVVELVRTSSVLSDRLERVATIQRSIDTLVEVRLQRGRAFDAADSRKLIEAARELASWHDDGKLAGWLRDIETALGASL